MKGLYSATYSALETYFAGNWDTVGGTLASLSLTEGDYVGLPTDTWSMTNFTVDEYETVVAGIKDGSISISNSTDELPEVGSHTDLTVVD
jgi:basic membrane protein A